MESMWKTAKQKTETRRHTAERSVARCLTISVICNRPLDFESTREGPVLKKPGKCRCIGTIGGRGKRLLISILAFSGHNL